MCDLFFSGVSASTVYDDLFDLAGFGFQTEVTTVSTKMEPEQKEDNKQNSEEKCFQPKTNVLEKEVILLPCNTTIKQPKKQALKIQLTKQDTSQTQPKKSLQIQISSPATEKSTPRTPKISPQPFQEPLPVTTPHTVVQSLKSFARKAESVPSQVKKMLLAQMKIIQLKYKTENILKDANNYHDPTIERFAFTTYNLPAFQTLRTCPSLEQENQ